LSSLAQSRSLKIGASFEISRFARGAAGILYRCATTVSNSTTPTLVVKLLRSDRTAESIEAITRLHRAIANQAAHFPTLWQSLLRGLPFWIGEVEFQGEQRIALFCLDLGVLGFVQFNQLLEPEQWKHYHKLDLAKRMTLATSFVRSYALLERLQFLHADINTENLFVNLQTLEAILIDFDAGVLLVNGDEQPQTPGKPNEFLAPELKSKSGIGLPNRYAERWAVGFMVHTLIFAIHPLFFLAEISVTAIRGYLEDHKCKWPKIGLFAFVHDVNVQSFYWHFTLRELRRFEKLRPQGFSLMQRFINDGALHPEKRSSAKEWVRALVEEPRTTTDPTSYCSFCGNIQKEARMLVESQNVYICDVCINLCTGILREKLNIETKEENYKLTYINDFSNADEKWPEDSLYAGDINAFRRDGFYHLALRRPYGIGRFYYQWLKEPYVEAGKIAVEAGLAPGFTARTADDAFYGILFRWSRDFYYAFCVSRQGKYWLFRYSDGENAVVINWVPCNQINREAGLNTLEVNFRSTDICTAITMRVNGKDIATLVDDTPGLASGLVGVCVGSLVLNGQPEAHFRNFQVFVKE
jgi:hypothetical protein